MFDKWRVELLPIHGARIINEKGDIVVDDIYDEDIARQIVREHNAGGVLAVALTNIAPARRCWSFTTGLGACFSAGRTVDAEYAADKCCAACIAYQALDQVANNDVLALANKESE